MLLNSMMIFICKTNVCSIQCMDFLLVGWLSITRSFILPYVFFFIYEKKRKSVMNEKRDNDDDDDVDDGCNDEKRT